MELDSLQKADCLTKSSHVFIDSISEIRRSMVPSNILPRLLKEDQPIFQIQNITEAEVIKIIAALRNSRDVHGIDNNFLKTHKDALIQPITLIVNQSIKGQFRELGKRPLLHPSLNQDQKHRSLTTGQLASCQ